MIEGKLAEGEAEHANRGIDDPFPRKGCDQHEALARSVDDIEQLLAGKAPLGVRS